MKISVFGTGYVGLVTGTCFAEMGNDVICADVDERKIEKLKSGVSPIYEPSLETLLRENMKDKRLTFSTDLEKAVKDSDLLFIAVGTPSDEDGSADLSHVVEVARTIGRYMNGFKLVINKSTVPVGTAQRVKKAITQTLLERSETIDFEVISNPEFLKEGAAVEDCLKPSRIVIGCETARAKKIMEELYEPFLRNGNPLLSMDLASAEMTKYAANAMLATKISFMNELSLVCEKTGADIEAVRQGIGSDPRIGYAFIYPGLGYGGSCFPKDVKALIHTGRELGLNLEILQSVQNVNLAQRTHFFSKIERSFGSDLKGKRFALWGVSFKPGTDDIRDAPSIDLIQALAAKGATVCAYDPVALEPARELLRMSPHFSQIHFTEHMYDALEKADALIIATEWKPFRKPDLAKMKAHLKAPIIFDGRNLYDPAWMKQQGFQYSCIGRGRS